jgi:hypothetical protein
MALSSLHVYLELKHVPILIMHRRYEYSVFTFYPYVVIWRICLRAHIKKIFAAKDFQDFRRLCIYSEFKQCLSLMHRRYE